MPTVDPSLREVSRWAIRSPLVCLLMLMSSPVSGDDGTGDEKIRFNRDVRPILSNKCFACHGPDATNAAAGLRLDLSEEAKDAGAIVPGDVANSELVNRIFSTDADVIMPPPETHKPLTDRERKILRRWIAEGAAYEAHWAYTPMRRAPADVTGNLVDHFVTARLAKAKVAPVERADRVTLIRRLSLDLTGIPPTIEEVDRFVNDRSDDAYAKLVDRLLSSPRYGERMTAYWLDLVRYADTVGYHGDQNVSQWAYRDYVINAFNSNLPYDRFIREQLAGDLLPNATVQQQIASGYNRLNQTTEEGGSQAKEYLAIYFADRVRNVSQVFMGSTLGCAQCHDHKYDPFTAKDFYAFGAFFADLEERGVYGGRGTRPPVLKVATEQQKQRIAELNDAIKKAEAKRGELHRTLLAKLSDWQPSPSVEVTDLDDVQPTDRTYSGTWKFVAGPGHPVQSGDRSRVQQGDGLVQHFFQNSKRTVTPTPLTQFFTWVYLDPKNPPRAVMLQFNDGTSWDHRAVWGSDDIGFGKRDQDWNGYRRMGALPKTGGWVRLEVDAKQLGLASASDTKAKPVTVNGMAFTQFGGRVWWDRSGWTESIPAAVQTALATPENDRTEVQRKVVRDHYLSTEPTAVKFERQLQSLRGQLQQVEKSVSTTVVSRSVTPREIRILPRGNWMDDSGEIVQPAVPQFLGTLDTGNERATRLDLANWLTQPDHPLTARTMVNRVWGLMFGRGICVSVDDFGGQGTYPADPDLLDALAVEFVESGWDIKHLIRLIASSDAYQRSSTPTPELRERDPYNDLFARQGRFRVDAETVRDSALAISGLLVEKVGGPSARPYQPAGYYAQLNFPRRTYTADMGEQQYRRGLYTHWQRTFLHPMMKAFDAPSREECTALRARSSTPVQALTLLNDPTFVEAARVFAARVLDEGGDDVRERIVWAYRAAISREPEPEIVDALIALYDGQLQIYRDDPEAARKLLATGQAKLPENANPAELAAWTNVARTVLNLHETIMRY